MERSVGDKTLTKVYDYDMVKNQKSKYFKPSIKFNGDCEFFLLPVSRNFRNIKKLLLAILRCAMPYLTISLTINCASIK